MSSSILPLILQFIGLAPVIAIEIVGIIIALVRWNRHRKASLLIVLGLGISIFSTVGHSIFVATFMMRVGPSSASFSTYVLIAGLIRMAAHAIGLSLLLWGAFADRITPPAAGFEPILKPASTDVQTRSC